MHVFNIEELKKQLDKVIATPFVPETHEMIFTVTQQIDDKEVKLWFVIRNDQPVFYKSEERFKWFRGEDIHPNKNPELRLQEAADYFNMTTPIGRLTVPYIFIAGANYTMMEKQLFKINNDVVLLMEQSGYKLVKGGIPYKIGPIYGFQYQPGDNAYTIDTDPLNPDDLVTFLNWKEFQLPEVVFPGTVTPPRCFEKGNYWLIIKEQNLRDNKYRMAEQVRPYFMAELILKDPIKLDITATPERFYFAFELPNFFQFQIFCQILKLN